jgi:hypothetical protein
MDKPTNPMDICAVEWRPVIDWPQYEVSTEGQVRCLTMSGVPSRKRRQPRFKKPSQGKDGYLRVSLQHKKGTKVRTETWLVHRLVATMFIPGDTSLHVAHKDGNKINNNIENLEWVTRTQNEQHKKTHGRFWAGARIPLFCDKHCLAIKRILESTGCSQRVLAEAYGVCQQTICNASKKATALLKALEEE